MPARRGLQLVFALLLTLALCNPAQPPQAAQAAPTGATYYVDWINGSDSNPGTSRTQAWKTIQKAADSMAAGDTTTVLAASPDERVHVSISGTSGAPITYQAEGTVVMQGFTVLANYVSVIGFEITNTPDDWQDGHGIFVEGSNCLIEGNYVHYATRSGIIIWASMGNEDKTNHCIVRNNRLYRNATAGIEVYGRDNLIEGNEIWGTIQYHPNWKNPPSSVDADGMRFFGSGHIIRGNYIHDITYSDPENIDPHIDCFQTWAGSDREVGHDVVFEKNICVNLEALGEHKFGTGFMLDGGASNLTIRNNIIRAYKVINAINSPNLEIENNIFTNKLSLPTNYYPVMVYLSGSPNALIKNNIFYDPEGTIISIGDTQSRQGLDVGYNCVFRSDGRQPSGSPFPHDLWQVNPLFVNAAAGDFHLLPISPAIDRGITLTDVVDDYDGKTRPQGSGYDIGIYERARVAIYSSWLPIVSSK